MARIVGNRIERPLSASASGVLLREACSFNETLQQAFPFGKIVHVTKGVYRFASHEDANRHQDECLAEGMAKIEGIMRTITP